jgi:two-component system response regulator NreC
MDRISGPACRLHSILSRQPSEIPHGSETNMKSATKILLLDNHQMVRQGLQQLIAAKPGLTVVGEASSTQEAMVQIETSVPHVVLMDADPAIGENRVESARPIIAKFPAVKIIALSSGSELQFALEALHAGVAGYVVKKHGVEELFRAIQVVMDYGLYLSPEISSEVTKRFMMSYLGRTSARAGAVLNDRERSLLQMVARGKRNKEIAKEIELGIKSVETYRSRLMKKLGCDSAAALVRYAICEGIVQI